MRRALVVTSLFVDILCKVGQHAAHGRQRTGLQTPLSSMGRPGQIKNEMNRISVDDNQRKSSDVGKTPVRKLKAKESKISENSPPGIGKSTRSKKAKSEENSKKKIELQLELAKELQAKRSSEDRNTEKHRRNSMIQNDCKKIEKDTMTEDEDYNLDFSAIEDKIFEDITAAENKKAELKSTKMKKTDIKKSTKLDLSKKSRPGDRDHKRKKLTDGKSSSPKVHHNNERKERRSSRKSPEPGPSKSKDRCSSKSVIPNEQTKTEKKSSVRKNKEASMCSSKGAKETDDDDYNLDFSALEDKIFEDMLSGDNKKADSKSKRIKSDLKKCDDVEQKKRSRTSDNEHKRKKSDGKDISSKTPKKTEERKSRNERKSPQPGSSKSKTRHSSKSRTPNNKRKPSKGRSSEKLSKGDSDSDMSDWEEVESRNEVMEMEELLSGSQPTVGEGTVQIELDAPNLLWGIRRRKRRTEEEMIEDYLRKSVNRSIKEVYENMHKTHLLCLFAHGRHVNQTLNKETLLGAALSIITDKNAYPPKRLDMSYLEKFVKWFSRKITYKPGDLEKDYWDKPLETILEKTIENKCAITNKELTYVFVVVCRALGMNVRLVLSLQPMSWKPGADVLIKPKKSGEQNEAPKEPSTSKTQELKKEEPKMKIKSDKKPNKKMLSTDDEEEQVEEKKRKKTAKPYSKGKMLSRPQKRKSNTSDDEEDLDFAPNMKKMTRGPKNQPRRKSGEKRPSDEDSEEKNKKKKAGQDDKGKKKKAADTFIEWAEIYVEEEEKWVCIDVSRGKIHCVTEIQVRMPSTSAYITAYNANLTVKDVTRRYVSNWLSSERKIRLCSKWWAKSLSAFKGLRSRLDKEEDKEMDQNLHHQPLPKTIGEYKNHPLYALQRHLLKFEAIYPPDVGAVGFMKSEPVYPRDSVYTLCSRDTWMKEAKTVRVDEEPYKIVKARPKWDKNTCQVIKDKPLELFGEWQVEDYEPPVAKDGKVPRNEYGNVELFKPTMLPKGCVHIPINGLNRLARKLNIDCAPAMVGFDFHSGWTHPVYDGFVVCEEFRDTLIDAWNEYEAEQARKAEEKRVKRIYDNWKKLIHGMLVKERVREKYGITTPVQEEEVEQLPTTKTERGEEDVDAEKEKKEETEAAASGPVKRKIKQEDIDAVRPPLITHHVKNLKIDWSSNVVEMARKNKKINARPKNPTKKKERVAQKKKDAPTQKDQPKDESVNLEADSDSDTDEEEKKAKIRAILDWGTKVVETNPDLSDDSDNEGEKKPSGFGLVESDAHPFYSSIIKPVKNKAKKQRQVRARKKVQKKSGSNSGSEEEQQEKMSSASTSRSTTPEPDLKDFEDAGQRRTSRRSAVKKVSYMDDKEESEGDISLDESDCGDHLYEPQDKK